MWTGSRILLVFLLAGLGFGSTSGRELRLASKTVVQFATEQEAAKELSQPDAFIESMSPFDRAARKQTDRPVGQAEFLSFISAQVLSWEATETEPFERIMGSISNKFAPYRLNFPGQILMVKTTGREEGHAAYCRGTNVIVLPREKLKDSPEELEDLLIHELFHILSRNNRDFRDLLYGIVGYKVCPEIDFPAELKPRKITNPDAPKLEHYIEVVSEDKTVPVVPILFSKQARYDADSGKDFFAYLTFKLLAIEKAGNGWKPQNAGGKSWLLDPAEVKNFHEQIGRNTGYVIHPEELLADNFVFLVNQKRGLPTPQIIDQMRRLLIKP